MSDTGEKAALAKYEYFYVVEQPLEGTRKTHRYRVHSCSTREWLGTIEWYGAWHQFVFAPKPQTVWSPSCLMDITAALGVVRMRRDALAEARK